MEGDNPEEIKKQKAIKGLLNKITPEKFDKILADIIAVGYETEETESGLINQVHTTMQSPFAQPSCRFIDPVRSEIRRASFLRMLSLPVSSRPLDNSCCVRHICRPSLPLPECVRHGAGV